MGWEKEISTWAAVAVAAIAFAALCWSIWRHRHQTKLLREQHQECVSLEASCERSGEFPSSTVRAELVNTGHIPVYVDEVSLRWGPPEPSRRKLLKLVKKHGLVSVGDRIPLEQADQKPNPVAVGDRRVYYLPHAIPSQVLATALKCPASQVSIAAYSPTGEIGCVSGDQVVLVIQSMLKTRAQIAHAIAEQTTKGVDDLG